MGQTFYSFRGATDFCGSGTGFKSGIFHNDPIWRSAGSLCNTVKSLGRGTALDMRHETLGQLCYDCDVFMYHVKSKAFSLSLMLSHLLRAGHAKFF